MTQMEERWRIDKKKFVCVRERGGKKVKGQIYVRQI